MAQKKTELWSIYGARESKSGDRVNISIVKGEDGAKQFATISLKKTGGAVKVKLDEDAVVLKIKRLDLETKSEAEDF